MRLIVGDLRVVVEAMDISRLQSLLLLDSKGKLQHYGGSTD